MTAVTDRGSYFIASAWHRLVRTLGCLGLGCQLLLCGCQAIAGIEDRHYVGPAAADGGAPTASSAQCASYCKLVAAQCNTESLMTYHTTEACKGVCAFLPAGDPKAKKPTGNSVACRAKQADNARTTGEGLDMYCPAAGPGGAGVCGSNCESYCALYAKACPDDALDDCEARCKGLIDEKTFSSEKDHGGDTLQCRLVHVSNATVDGTTHCPHARIAHPDTWCVDPEDTPLDCKHYCQLVDNECTGDARVYEPGQCAAVCAAFAAEKVGDQTKDPASDTLACRLWHAYSAVPDPARHCAHAGPTGDGHCGDHHSSTPNCPPYCRLLESACAKDFSASFADQKACQTACAKLGGAKADSGYAVKTAEDAPASLQCRYLHVARVLAGTESSCDDAFGRGTHCHK